MSELFDKDKRTISEYIQHIFEEGELQEDSTVRNFRTVEIEGSREVSCQLEDKLSFVEWHFLQVVREIKKIDSD